MTKKEVTFGISVHQKMSSFYLSGGGGLVTKFLIQPPIDWYLYRDKIIRIVHTRGQLQLTS